MSKRDLNKDSRSASDRARSENAAKSAVTVVASAGLFTVVGNVTDMISIGITPAIDGKTIKVLGYYEINDGGGGYFRWSAESSEASNSGTVFESNNSVTGRWHRIIDSDISVLWFGAKGDGITNNDVFFKNAIDYAFSLFENGTYGSGGKRILIPPGKYVYQEIIMKNGISLVGGGYNKTALLLSGENSVGISCLASSSGLAADQVSYGVFDGISFLTNENTPTNQIIWDARGFSRWAVYNCFFEFCGGCTSISCVNGNLAGSGGPAQWYNEFYSCYFVRVASKPVGGVAVIGGDSDIAKEQVTTWSFFGGRFFGTSSGTGIQLRATGCKFFSTTFEGLSVAVEIGSDGTRGAASNSFYGCYWEGNTVNRLVKANGLRTMFLGSFITGGSDNIDSDTTVIRDPSVITEYLPNSVGAKHEFLIDNPIARTLKFRSKTAFIGVAYESLSGQKFILGGTPGTDPDNTYAGILNNDLTEYLIRIGLTTSRLYASRLYFGPTNTGMYFGNGSPEGSVIAPVGSIYLRRDGGVGSTLYVKESGISNTGWVAK